MKPIAIVIAVLVMSAALIAQETKPVPKDSVRVTISGCTKGYVFTVAPSPSNLPDTPSIPEGTHLRMNGPKKLIAEINDYKDSMVALTGLMKKGQEGPGVRLGGVRIVPGSTGATGSAPTNFAASPPQIDVEGWSPAVGKCLSK